jgi:uncharacterized membrane protein
MWLFKQPSTAAKTVLIYITTGALIMIWSAIWYVYLWNNPPENHLVFYWVTGFMVTGLVMVLIGLVLGRLGKSDSVYDLTRESASTVPPVAPLVVVNPAPPVVAPAPAPAPANAVAVADGQVLVPPAL